MDSPFKFLDSYKKEDREIFFGREREIEELYHRVFESRIMLVYGVSGTGKSSLIHCGLANKFSETDWLPLVVRRGRNMLESMASAIRNASATLQPENISTPAQFKKAVRSLYLDHYKPLFFIFDQFEELFIFGNKEEKRSFIQVIKILVEADLQCRFIFVLREEYMANISDFEKYIPIIFANRVRIEKMSHLNALDSINGPCRVFSIKLEDGFAEALLEKLNPESGEVELTYLQVYLDKVFRLAQTPGKDGSADLSFTLSHLQNTGNVSDLLGSFLDEQVAIMKDPDLAMTVLKAFVSGKGSKRPANENETVENVRSLGKEISAESVTELLQAFVGLRVLSDKDDLGRYELRHDALAEKIYEKFSIAEKELLEIRQFIENGYQYYLRRKVLFGNEDLSYISNKDSLLNLNSSIQAFLSESRKYEQNKIRTVKRLTIISACAFIIVMCFLGYFVSTKSTQVSANNLAIRSINQIKEPIGKLRAATASWGKSQEVLAKEALIKAFNEIINSQDNDSITKTISGRYKLTFESAPLPIEFAICSGNNNLIYGYGDSLILIWNRNGNLLRSFMAGHFPIIDIKISEDNKYLGIISKDSLLSISDITGKELFTRKIRYNLLNTRQIFRFTRNNNILALSPDHDAVLYDTTGKMIQVFGRHTSAVNAVDISEDGNFIATASSDYTINIWYLNSIKNSFDYYNTLNYHKDIVWSVRFSDKSISVLSASADKKVYVGSINNEVLGKSSRVLGKSVFRAGFTFCEAFFSKSNEGIYAVSYSVTNNKLYKYYHGMSYRNPIVYIKTYFISGRVNSMYQTEPFSYFDFSPDENYFAFTIGDDAWLSDNRLTMEKNWSNYLNSNHVLTQLIGSKPFFTSDSKYILSIRGNSIHTVFIDIMAISEEAKKIMN